MRLTWMLPLLSLLLALSGQAAAQTLPPKLMGQVNAASQIRVRLASGERGTIDAPTMDTARLSYTGSRVIAKDGSTIGVPQPLPLTQITQIQVPHGSNAVRGAKIGAAIGLGIAALAVATTTGSDFASPTPKDGGRAIVGFTVLGAGLGALLGRTSPRWITVYGATAP
jgi:hypothetical protein